MMGTSSTTIHFFAIGSMSVMVVMKNRMSGYSV